MGDIKLFDVVKEKVANITLNDTNPNEMTVEQMNALKKGIAEFGFLEPIIINKENRVIDGEHRFIALKDLGMEEIPVIRMEVTEENARIIRQTMNKVRGKHDPRKDIEDLFRISKDIGVEELGSFLGMESKNLSDYLDSVNQKPESFLEFEIAPKEKAVGRKTCALKLTEEQSKKIKEAVGEDFNMEDVAFLPLSALIVADL